MISALLKRLDRCVPLQCDGYVDKLNCTAAFNVKGVATVVGACPRTVVGPVHFDGNDQLDVIIFHVFFQSRGGSFVEVGGQNGIFASNTRALERFYGWNGLLIEPACYDDMVKNRPTAATVRGAICNDYAVELPGSKRWCSGRDRTVVAPCHDLGELIIAHIGHHVDFVSIDIEGHEMVALKQIVAYHLRPRVVLVEWRPKDADSRKDFMRSHNYGHYRFRNDELFWDLGAMFPGELFWDLGAKLPGLHRPM